MKILCIDATASFLDFALRCEAAGHEVRVFMGPAKDGSRFPIGDGLITKVPDWKPSMKWADLILLSDNVKYIRELESYRASGYPIFGPNLECTNWELERGTGQDVLEDHGIKCLPSTIFKTYDEAIAFLNQNPEKRYVSKPTGDADKALSYVSKSSQDMMFMLDHWKRKMTKKVPFLFQEFTPGIEMAVGGWMGRNGFLSHFLENFEFKKLMNGEVGVNTGEQGCYSFDSEVLTDSGWKFWPDVTKADKLATLVDGKLTFETPSVVVSFDVNGDMIQWKNRSIDVLVTPNHNMYVAGQSSARKGDPDWKFVKAEDCTEAQYLLNRTADWEGESPEVFVCPGNTWNTGIGDRKTDDVVVPFNEWCKFLGIYFAEGSSSPGQVQIAQSHPAKFEKVQELLSGFPLKFTPTDNGFRLSCSAVARMVKPFGRSYEKRVPDYIKNATSEDILTFLDAFCLGDGHTQKNGSRYFYTSNPGLADDLQELMLKCGRLGIVKKLKRKETLGTIDGRTIHQRRDAYVVYERAKKTTGWLDARDKEVVKYTGKVYCATVSSHILYVRRNGKPMWCGNTTMKYVTAEESLLAQKVLLPLEAALIRSGYTGYIDVAVIIDKKGNPWPLEFTSRPGWPLFQIQQALHPDPCEWMLDALNGKDTFKPFDDIAVGVVVTIPDFPYTKLTRKEVTGFPVWGITEKNRFNVHPCEMMMGEGPVYENGKIKTKPMLVTAGDYVLVTTGAEPTVCEAKDAAYGVLKQLEIPNSPMYRTDIGCRLEKQLPELQALGYATAWEW